MIQPVAAAITTGYRIAGRNISRPLLAVVALVAAMALVVPKRLWRWSRLGITAVHESGHATVALLVGRKVTAIHLRPDASGVTIHYGPGGWFRRSVTAAAGYPAPGLLALAGAGLILYQEPRIWLVALLALGVVNVVLWIRNFFGFVVMAGWIGALGWLFVRGTTGIDALVSAVTVWFLVLGGLRAATEVPHAPATSDAADIGRLLHLPSGLCKAGFVLAAFAAVIGCAFVLAARPR